MNGFATLYRKELGAIFYSPIAYVVLATVMLILAYTFCAQLFHTLSPNLVGNRYQTAMLLILSVPLITMRQIAEERTNRTLELLLSTPVGDAAVVVAKFAACCTLIGLILALTLVFPFVLERYTAIDWGVVLAGVLGLALCAMALTALGLAISAVSANQVVAGALSLALFLMLWMAESLGVFLPRGWGNVVIGLSFDTRLAPFVTGSVYLSDVGYFLGLTFLGLWLATLALAHR